MSTLSFGKLKALKIPFNVYYDVLGWRPSNISFRVADLDDVFVIVKFFPKFNFIGILNM